MGKLIGIAGKEKEGEEMMVYASAKVSIEKGIGDDYRGTNNNDRQVSIISIEDWNKVCKELNRNLHWTKREANLIVEGVDFVDSIGNIVKIGEVFFEVTGQLKAGNKMEKVTPKLKELLNSNPWSAVTCKVISNGVINEGDVITLMERV